MEILRLPNKDVGLTVSEVVGLFIDDIEYRELRGDVAAKSAEKLRRYCTSFRRAHGRQLVEDCRNDDLTGWLADNPRWRSDHTKENALRCVIACFAWAVEERLIRANPYSRPKQLKLHLRPRDGFTPEDFAAMLRQVRRGRGYVKTRRALRCSLHFLWRSGARTCEMRHALWDELDWDEGFLCQRVHKTDRTGEDRIIGIEDGLLRLLRWMYATRKNDRTRCNCEVQRKHCIGDHIFRCGRGKPWTCGTFAQVFRRYARWAGVSDTKSAYSLRHGFCVRAILAGVGERQIADQLGHTSTRYVSWYGRQSRRNVEHLRNVARQAQKRPDAS